MFLGGLGVDSDANLRQSLPTRWVYKRLSFPTEAVDLTMHAVGFSCSDNSLFKQHHPSLQTS